MTAEGGLREDQDLGPDPEDEDGAENGPEDGVLGGALAVTRLENQLDRAIRYGDRMNRALYRLMNADLEAALRRADRAEAELAAVRASATYRVGRAITAVPARVRRRLRPGPES